MWGNESDVVTWRNQVFGHGVFHHDPEYYAHETLRWLPVLHDFYEALLPLLADWRLVAILPHGREVAWHGSDARAKPLDHAHIPGAAPAPMELRHSDGRKLSLVPLLSVQPCGVCNDPAAFFFNRHQFKGGNQSYDTSFLEYDRGHANKLPNWTEVRTVIARLPPSFKWERTAYDATEALMATEVVVRDFDDEFQRPAYVLNEIWDIIDNTSNGYVDVVGRGGVGKTYLARGLVADGNRPATAVLAYHIVPGVLTDYRSFVVELSMQARETLRLRTQEPQTQGSTPKDLRREIVAFLGTLWTANQLDALVVVIDGLDELPEPSDGSISIVDLLPDPSQLPEGCFVILTRRPELRPTAARLIRRLNADASECVHAFSLDPVSPDALALLRSYLERRLPPAWCTAESIDAIVARSGGVFLYAFHLVSALRSGAFAVRASLPTAADFYPTYLAALHQRAGDELFSRVYEPLLVFIAAAHQPISVEQLASWGIPRTLIPFALLDVRDFLRRVTPALNDQQGMNDRFEIAHEEFRTWLGNDEHWRSKIRATHSRIGLVAINRHGGRWHEHVPDDEIDYYDLLWTEAHLELGRVEEKLRNLRSDSTYPYACRQAAVQCLGRGRLATALALVERAVAVYRRPEALKQVIWFDDLADALADRATVLEALGRLTEAIVTLDEAIDLYRQVVASGRLAPQRELAGLLLRKANILDRLRRPQEALALYDEARHLDALFEKIDPDSANHRAGQWALNRGSALINLGQLDEPERCCRSPCATSSWPSPQPNPSTGP